MKQNKIQLFLFTALLFTACIRVRANFPVFTNNLNHNTEQLGLDYTFCYADIALTLYNGGAAQQTRYGITGVIIKTVSGKWTLYGEGGGLQTVKIKFDEADYEFSYTMIRDGFGSPAKLIDSQGRDYSLCKTSQSSDNYKSENEDDSPKTHSFPKSNKTILDYSDVFRREQLKKFQTRPDLSAGKNFRDSLMKIKIANLYNHRGISKDSLGDYKGAIADFTKSIEINPNGAVAYKYRGIEKLRLGDKNEARLDWSKADELGDKEALEMIRKYFK
jgi:tetratricopeptide (TPR) repeat protein